MCKASAMWLGRAVITRLHTFFGSPGDPRNLAVFRMTVFAVIAVVVCRIDFVHLATLPPMLRVAPPGYGTFFHLKFPRDGPAASTRWGDRRDRYADGGNRSSSSRCASIINGFAASMG